MSKSASSAPTSQRASSRSDQIRQRNDRILTYTLIELLSQLVFVAMALGLLLSEQTRREFDPRRDSVVELKKALGERDATIVRLKTDIAERDGRIADLESFVKRLLAKFPGGALPANPDIIVRAVEESKNKDAIIAQQQQQIAGLLKQVGRGGVDRPNCPVTPTYMFAIDLLPTGRIQTRPAWDANASSAVQGVDGVAALVSAGPLTIPEFRARAAVVDAWARRQDPACGFRVLVYPRHKNFDLYMRQSAAVKGYFYDAVRR